MELETPRKTANPPEQACLHTDSASLKNFTITKNYNVFLDLALTWQILFQTTGYVAFLSCGFI